MQALVGVTSLAILTTILQVVAGVSSSTTEALSQMTTTVYDDVESTGSAARPHCTWNQSPCVWDPTTQHNCALRLCLSAGYTHGTYLNASNNPCTAGATSASYYGVLMHTGAATFGSWGHEAAISARCSNGALITRSTGSAALPYCSWDETPCVWNATTQQECADAVCHGMGYTYAGFIESSNSPCTASYASGSHYFALMGTGTVRYGSWANDARVEVSLTA